MNAVQKKQLVFALRAVIVILVLVLAAVANPVSASQVALDDVPARGTARGSANGAPVSSSSSSLGSSSSAGEVEIFGVVESINGSTWVIDGKTVTVSGATEVKGALGVGSRVKVHLIRGVDGSLTAREIEPALGAGGADDNSGDDNVSGGDDSNDDNSGRGGSDDSDDDMNDDSSGHDSNDDHGSSGSDDDHDDDDDNSGSGSDHSGKDR